MKAGEKPKGHCKGQCCLKHKYVTGISSSGLTSTAGRGLVNNYLINKLKDHITNCWAGQGPPVSLLHWSTDVVLDPMPEPHWLLSPGKLEGLSAERLTDGTEALQTWSHSMHTTARAGVKGGDKEKEPRISSDMGGSQTSYSEKRTLPTQVMYLPYSPCTL
jgi:hypothetical protein